MLFNKLNDQIIVKILKHEIHRRHRFRKTWMEVQELLSTSTPNINGVNSDSASIDFAYGVVKKSEITLDSKPSAIFIYINNISKLLKASRLFDELYLK